MAESAIAEANTSRTEMSTLRISQITVDMTGELRRLVLWPDKPECVHLDEDKHGYHFGAFVPSQVKPVGVISVYFEPIPSNGTDGSIASGDHGTSARFRRFACHPDFQGQGIGTGLLRCVASLCSRAGATVLWCGARLNSRQWYEKRGFTPFSAPYPADTLQCIRMKMVLVNCEAEGEQLRAKRITSDALAWSH